jgi:hypothetical protein
MSRKCIVQERPNSFETLELYPESKSKIIQFHTVAQSIHPKMKNKIRSRTLNKITGELLHGLFVR